LPQRLQFVDEIEDKLDEGFTDNEISSRILGLLRLARAYHEDYPEASIIDREAAVDALTTEHILVDEERPIFRMLLGLDWPTNEDDISTPGGAPEKPLEDFLPPDIPLLRSSA